MKNVGEGPIEAILAARDKEFESLDDFCQRADLRKVGKRALESLIKVGAFEEFATRAQLLAVIERMTRLSATTHQAADVGQTSLFDMASFDVPVTGSILNPVPVVEDIRQRVLLGWEKELVGTYVSAHPLDGRMEEIRAAVTRMCGDLEELRHDRQVRVAGLISKVRHTTTKKGDTMAFVEIEDTQGSMEIVVFPRTFAAFQHLLATENLVVVSGKVDAKDADRPKILADGITTELKTYRPIDDNNGSNGYTPPPPPDETPVLRETPVPYEVATSSGVDLLDEPEMPPSPWVTETKPVMFILPRANKLDEDVRKLNAVHRLLKANPGERRFELCIPQNGVGVLVAFDELSITLDGRMREKLDALGVQVQE